MGWFSGVTTVKEIKALYRRLAKAHHPDWGGSNEVMAEINSAYHDALSGRHGETSSGWDGKPHTYYYRRDVEQGAMDKISELLGLKLQGCTIELIGTWVWVSGDTKPVRHLLKAAGMRWHRERRRWYWRQWGRSAYTGVPFAVLRSVYGSKIFEVDAAETAVSAA